MVKIKTSLLTSYAIIIGLLLLLSSFLVLVFSNIESKYRALSDTMILEYRITETFSQMIDSYAGLLQSPSDDQNRARYDLSGSTLDEIFSQLDTAITFPASREIYLKIRNIAVGVKKDCDNNLSDLSAGRFSKGTGVYDRAIRGRDYVRENTADLVLKELEHSKELQAQLQTLRVFTLISSLILTLIIVFGSSFYGIRYSNKLSATLLKLANTVETISKGDLHVNVSADLLERKDEIGSLSHSFERMVQKLGEMIQNLNQSNQELDSMNKLMIGRETKMVELKGEIAALKEEKAAKTVVPQSS